MVLQNGFQHIDILIIIVFSFETGFGSVTPEVSVHALSDTKVSQIHTLVCLS